MDVDEELIDYQETEEEDGMIVEGDAGEVAQADTKMDDPGQITDKTRDTTGAAHSAEVEDGDDMPMLDEDATREDVEVNDSVADLGDAEMAIGEKGDNLDQIVEVSRTDTAMSPEEVVPTAEKGIEDIGDEAEEPEASHTPHPPAELVAVASDPTVLESAEDNGARATEEVAVDTTSTSWPPDPTAVPPVPSLVPTVEDLPSEIVEKHQEAAAQGPAMDTASVLAEAPRSPRLSTIAASEISAQVGGEEQQGERQAILDTSATSAAENEGEAEASDDKIAHTDDTEGKNAADEPGGSMAATKGTSPESKEESQIVGGNELGAKSAEHTGLADDGDVQETFEAHESDAQAEYEDDETYDDDEGEGEEEDHKGSGGDEDSGTELSLPPMVIAVADNDYRPLFSELPDDIEVEVNRKFGPMFHGLGLEIAQAPLSEFFVALRGALEHETEEDATDELVLHERDLKLRIGEDNKHALDLTLLDLVDLHRRCNCVEPMILHVEHESSRFIAKFNAIKQYLDEADDLDGDRTQEDDDQSDYEDETETADYENATEEGDAEGDAEEDQFSADQDDDEDDHGIDGVIRAAQEGADSSVSEENSLTNPAITAVDRLAENGAEAESHDGSPHAPGSAKRPHEEESDVIEENAHDRNVKRKLSPAPDSTLGQTEDPSDLVSAEASAGKDTESRDMSSSSETVQNGSITEIDTCVSAGGEAGAQDSSA